MRIIEWALRVSLSAGFLSAVADRFGWWPEGISVWGNWTNFVDYTQTLLPFFPNSWMPVIGGMATLGEVLLGISLLVPFKTELVAKCSGVLLLLFGISMAISVHVKAPLDYSVFTASAAAFALGWIVSDN